MLIDELRSILTGQAWLIALDRDGTLAPIVPDPAQARIPGEVGDTVAALARQPGVHVAIVSARGLPGLSEDFDPELVILAGSYGLDISFPSGERFTEASALRSKAPLTRVKERFSRLVAAESRLILEDHAVSLCLHWHMVPVDRQVMVHDLVGGLTREFPELRFKRMPTSYEVQPPVPWDKAHALSEIEQRLNIDRGRTAYLYAGDSQSDEAAFQWVNSRAGASIKVGISGSTAAAFTVPAPSDLWRLLEEVLSFRRGQKGSSLT